MSKQAKESFFSKKSKSDSEKREADQQKISKMIALFTKKWNDPIVEVDKAFEDGIEVGKKHNKLNFEDAVRKETEARIDDATKKVIEEAKTFVEGEVEEQLKTMDLKKMTSYLMKRVNKEEKTAIICIVDLKGDSREGIVGAYGSAKDCAKVLTLAAKAHDHMENSILLAAKDIVEDNLDKKITKVTNLNDNGEEKDDCDCPACTIRRALARA